MKNRIGVKTLSIVALMSAGLAMPAAADESANLIINGDLELTTHAPAPAHVENLDEVISGWVFRSDETQVLQMDDFDNPGMIFVDQAMEEWNKVDGSEGKSCASCHEDVETSMKGVRAVYPKWNESAGEVRTLVNQINDCRENQMGAEKWKNTGGKIVAMEALISLQSRGMPVNVAIDGPVKETWEKGKELYYTRTGQLELSCANCHEDNYGNMIRADHLSQGNINGFPTYRFKWQGLGSLHRRFKGCMENIRAEGYKRGSDEFLALEAYLTWRGAGLGIETPSVRN